MTRSTFRALFVLLLCLTGAAAVQAEAQLTYTLQNVVRVSRPGLNWAFETDPSDPAAVNIVDKADGLQVVLRWVANQSGLESKRAAVFLMSRLMREENSTGRNFSFPRTRQLAGEPASTFTVEHAVDHSLTHRTQYVVVSHGKNCLIVALSGGAGWMDKHQKELDVVLNSIRFLH